MSKFLYAPEGGEGSGGGTGSATGGAASTANSSAGAGSQGGGTLLSGGTSSSGGGAGNGSTAASSTGGTGTAVQGGQAAGTAGAGAPVVSKSFREGWIGSDGKIDKTAYDRLPENLRPFKDTFSKYDTDEALLSAFAHSVSLNGKKGLMPLPKDASEADKEAFNGRLRELLNVPKDPAGYGVLEKPKDIPDSLWNGEYVQTMAGIMHKFNAPPEMVKELFAADQKFGATAFGKSQSSVIQAQQKAKEEVVQAFGANMDAELAGARRAAQTVGIDVNDPSIGNNPKVIIALSKVAKLLGEDKMVRPGTGESGGGVGGDDRTRAKDIVMNKSNPLHEAYHDPKHGGHSQAVAQYQALLANWSRTQPKVA